MKKHLLLLLLILLASCQVSTQKSDLTKNTDTPVEARMRELGLVNIAEADSSIAIHLVYATPYNFMGRKLYHGMTKAFAHPVAVEKLIKAKELLKAKRPDLTLIVYDAARPLSVQKQMWDSVKDTPMQDFVADPTTSKGMHNFAAAVDVTLLDSAGNPLSMGSEFDCFTDDSRINNEQQLLKDGRISVRELEHRLLLREVMTQAGFLTYDAEWWHFNAMDPKVARKMLQIIK